MTQHVPDELLVLAWEALDWTHGRIPDVSALQTEWTTTHIWDRGPHTLSFWRGPETEAMALLTEGQPAERTLVRVDHRPCTRRPGAEPREGTFLQPGAPFHQQNDRLANFGIFAGWWPCEPGAKRLRLTRRGDVSEIEATSDGFILVDWSSPAPVERFDAVEIEAKGWVPSALPALPYTSEHIFRSYARFWLGGSDQSDLSPDLWAYDLFSSMTGDAWLDAVVALLRHADAQRDHELLLSFGALIYANGHPYYDRMERELKAGTIDPEVLGIVLSMEKPEFMDDELRIRHQRLAARCGWRTLAL